MTSTSIPVRSRTRSRNVSRLPASRTALVATARIADDAVAVHDAAEAFQRPQRRLDRGRPEPAAGERVLAQQHRPRGLLQDARRLSGRQLGDQHADGSRSHVEHRHRPELGGSQWRGLRVAVGDNHGNVSRPNHHSNGAPAVAALGLEPRGARGSRPGRRVCVGRGFMMAIDGVVAYGPAVTSP